VFRYGALDISFYIIGNYAYYITTLRLDAHSLNKKNAWRGSLSK